MSYLSQAIASVPWAIHPNHLPIICAVAERRTEAPELVKAREGKRLDNTHRMTIRDGVGIMPVIGPIIPHADLFAEISGATSIERLSLDLTRALEAPEVRAIMLHVDSPGGIPFGVGEFSSMVKAAAVKKPMKAYVSGMACSAAYWITSAVPEIVVDAQAMLGSIGVVSAHYVQEKPDQAGYRRMEVVSSNATNKRPDPTTDEGRAEIRRTCDQLESGFIATVAANRKMTAEQVIKDFGQGGVLVGEAAVAARMADRLGSFEQVLAELSGSGPKAAGHGAKHTGAKSMSKASDLDADIQTTWDADAAVREEFREFETYAAYRRAEASGQVKELGNRTTR